MRDMKLRDHYNKRFAFAVAAKRWRAVRYIQRHVIREAQYRPIIQRHIIHKTRYHPIIQRHIHKAQYHLIIQRLIIHKARYHPIIQRHIIHKA